MHYKLSTSYAIEPQTYTLAINSQQVIDAMHKEL